MGFPSGSLATRNEAVRLVGRASVPAAFGGAGILPVQAQSKPAATIQVD